NWLFSNYKKLDEETAEKYMIFLTWIFSATNNKLRDLGTKSLVKLFKTFPTKIIGLLKLFENNNDPYIVERLYASVLGATLRIDICEIHIEIANYIYEEIFDKEMVYPHILMRDYARQTIEYISLSKDISNINLEKIRPPYKSNWYKKEYSNLNIDDYIKSLKNKLDSHLHFSIDKIKNSMTTEYGRGTGAYGDFGRYVFGYAVRNWVKGFKSDQDLSNIALMRIFEMGYDAKLHGEFDMWVNRYDNFNNSIERISKKYQWIAYYEILAKLVDKFPDVQYSGLWDDYIRDIDPTLLLLEIDKESKILVPSPLPSHQSNEWVKNTKVFDETKLFLEIDIDNHRYICLSSKFNFEKREKEIPFEDRDSCYFLAMGYFYNKEDSNEIIKGYENNYDRGI
ncbi:TPA: ATP-binding protein, partial [Staphylococcus aureus]